MLRFLEPYQDRITGHRVFDQIRTGELSLENLNTGLVYFYPLVESFPKFMALTLSRVPPGDSKINRTVREWLIGNMNIERRHTRWWKDWALDFGVPANALDDEITLPAEIDSLNNYLWRVSTYGSLPEAIGAVNFAIEGPTGVWARAIKPALRRYKSLGAKVTKRTVRWVERHASYDDRHPVEALQIIRTHASTVEQEERVIRATQRSLEYYALALDCFYEGVQTQDAPRS